MMRIAVASGKGGTGKTTVAVSLALHLSQSGKKVHLLDCDVEEPNANLFLKRNITKSGSAFSLIPEVNDSLCNGCGKCGDICGFSAIVMIKDRPLVLPDMCHSCGGCFLACPRGAIMEREKEIGIIEESSDSPVRYSGGRLNIGQAMAPPLIKQVKKKINPDETSIIDCPPGTSCPVIEAVSGCDYTVLVTEPTPFGLHDLSLAVETARALGIKFGVVINRADSGDSRVSEYCARENIELIAEFPDSREIAELYSRGEFGPVFVEKFSGKLSGMLEKICWVRGCDG